MLIFAPELKANPPADEGQEEDQKRLNKLLREKGKASELLGDLKSLTGYLREHEKKEFESSRVREKMEKLIQELADRRKGRTNRRSRD